MYLESKHMVAHIDGLRGQVRDLNDEYVACLDNFELERWAEMFTDDALYVITARENFDKGLTHGTIWCEGRAMINDRVLSIRKTLIYEDRFLRHFLSGTRINGESDGVIDCQTNFMVVESMLDAKHEIIMLGRYVDKVKRVGGALRLRERQCVFDNHWLPRALALPI